MASTNRNSAAKARVIKAQAQALDLRRSGLGYAEIAETMGCSVSTAHGYIKRAMESARLQVEADVIDMRAEEISRLDGMLRGLWAKAKKGNVGAIDRVLKISERRSKLLGLDMPTKVALGGDNDAPPINHQHHVHTLSDAELERIAAGSSS